MFRRIQTIHGSSVVQKKTVTEDEWVNSVIKVDEKKYLITPKYKRWEKAFLDEKNPKTFGNQTQSAIVAYNLDPVRQYGTANRIGHENVVKHKDIMAKYFQKRGMTYGKILDVYMQKMVKSPSPDLLYSLASAVGAPLPDYQPISQPKNQTNVQNNIQGGMSLTFTKTDIIKDDA
jgi:hypothetical protein